MSGGYVLIAGILYYIFLLRTLDSPKMSPVKAAIYLMIGYVAFMSLVLAIEYSARSVPLLPNLLSPTRIVTAITQCIVAAGVFYEAEQSGDSYMSYMFWGGVGLALIFFIVPHVVASLIF